jgi:hypothetical protein
LVPHGADDGKAEIMSTQFRPAVRPFLVFLALAAGLVTVGGAGAAFAQAGQSPPPDATAGKTVPVPAASDEQQAAAEKAQNSEAGKAGTAEPGARMEAAKQDNAAVLVNGRLAVPGVPADGETVPAKFSERNAALDRLPTMAHALPLDAQQRRRIWDTLQGSDRSRTAFSAQPAEELPGTVDLSEVPHDLVVAVPAIAGYKYVRAPDSVLFVLPASRIVVGKVARPNDTQSQ